jgi:hypothetical protein
MYFIAKLAQAAGLGIIAIDFIRKFPYLMNTQILGAGILVFAFGWVIQAYLLKQ